LAAGGLLGIAYAGIVTLRARRQHDYQPVLEDWIWHSVLPFLAYTLLFVGAVVTARSHASGLFAIGAANLMLLFIGIHNAWDSIAYVATVQMTLPPNDEAP